jgi:dihydroflavonol-4-reductase
MSALFALVLAAAPAPALTVSIETDPVFWVGTVANGPAADFNVDFTFAAVPGLRVGALGWSGRWSGGFAQAAVMPAGFPEDDWSVRWSGAGVEAQYQLHLGLARGGLTPGLRVQWNQFRFDRGADVLAEANHLVITPQSGFQWFPFRAIGLYVLPWIGVQLPLAGTDTVITDEGERSTRRVLPVVTAHVGWAF